MASFKTYKGKYIIKKPRKYIGDSTSVTYRSGWERQAFLWCERSSRVLKWSSEELVIPYLCKTDNKIHKYYTDLMIKWNNNNISIIEIKPLRETKPPLKSKKNNKVLLNEAMTYIKNQSKWKAASNYTKRQGWKFEIWTEVELKKLGILKW